MVYAKTKHLVKTNTNIKGTQTIVCTTGTYDIDKTK